MRETPWIEWTRASLRPHERAELLAALTPEQSEQLLEHDSVRVEGVGVLWKPPDGALRRARFTHGAHFRTNRGEFYVDSAGSVRELLRVQRVDRPSSALSLASARLGDVETRPAGTREADLLA